MALIKFGTVSEIDSVNGLVRVNFPEDDLVSFPIPIVMPRTKNDKYFNIFDVNEHVVCLMDERCENGVVMGAIYNPSNKPESGLNEDITKVKFSDNSIVEYDRSTSVLTVEVSKTVIKASPTGIEISKVDDSLKDILVDLLTANAAETHNVTAVGSPTGPPINIADYTSILARINLFFTG